MVVSESAERYTTFVYHRVRIPSAFPASAVSLTLPSTLGQRNGSGLVHGLIGSTIPVQLYDARSCSYIDQPLWLPEARGDRTAEFRCWLPRNSTADVTRFKTNWCMVTRRDSARAGEFPIHSVAWSHARYSDNCRMHCMRLLAYRLYIMASIGMLQ